MKLSINFDPRKAFLTVTFFRVPNGHTDFQVYRINKMASLAVSETKKPGSFTLPGVGKLVLQKRKARKGRNPATGESINIPAKTVEKMRIAKVCKEAIVPPKGKNLAGLFLLRIGDTLTKGDLN
jgi:DNA-binding protein HU-beta